MSTPASIRGLDSLPGSVISILSIPWLAWDAVVYPIPKLTSSDGTDGTTFFPALAYLTATLVTALYFSQVWLFTMSAFGVVWLDSQMAWRAQQIGMAKMQQHITEQFESVQRSSPAAELAAEPIWDVAIDGPETPAEESSMEPPLQSMEELSGKPIRKLEQKEVDNTQIPSPNDANNDTDFKNTSQVFGSHIAAAALGVLPQVMEAHFTAEQTTRLRSEIEYQQQQMIDRIPPRHEVLQTVLETDISTSDDKNFTLMAEMVAVQRELAQVLGAHRSTQRAENPKPVVTEESTASHLEIPSRPKAPLSTPMNAEDIPALPEVPDDDDLDIFSMEELEEPSSKSSVRSFGDFVEALPPVAHDHSRPSTSHSRREAPHFPIIDDVLLEYEREASAPPEPEAKKYNDEKSEAHSQINQDHDHDQYHDYEALTSGDESRNGFSDESRPDSPATSVSTTHDDDDISVQPLVVRKQEVLHPQLEHVDSGLEMEMDFEEDTPVSEKLPEAVMLSIKETASDAVIELPIEKSCVLKPMFTAADITPPEQMKRPFPVHATSRSSTASKRTPKKNNGWKRVPKRARLSPREKKRFVSRAFW